MLAQYFIVCGTVNTIEIGSESVNGLGNGIDTQDYERSGTYVGIIRGTG